MSSTNICHKNGCNNLHKIKEGIIYCKIHKIHKISKNICHKTHCNNLHKIKEGIIYCNFHFSQHAKDSNLISLTNIVKEKSIVKMIYDIKEEMEELEEKKSNDDFFNMLNREMSLLVNSHPSLSHLRNLRNH